MGGKKERDGNIGDSAPLNRGMDAPVCQVGFYLFSLFR